MRLLSTSSDSTCNWSAKAKKDAMSSKANIWAYIFWFRRLLAALEKTVVKVIPITNRTIESPLIHIKELSCLIFHPWV